MRKTLEDEYERQGIGRVTVTRGENEARRKVVDAILVQDVVEGKAGEVALRAGDTVEVIYDVRVAENVLVTVNCPGLARGTGSFGKLPRRDMTVTEAIAAYGEIDPKSIAEAKVTLERVEKQVTHKVFDAEPFSHSPPAPPVPPAIEKVVTRKVFDAVPMRDLLDGKVKDEIVQSNDRIRIDK